MKRIKYIILIATVLVAGLTGCAKPNTAEMTDAGLRSENSANVTEADVRNEDSVNVTEADIKDESSALPENAGEESEQITFKDALEREVTVSDPQRVAILLGSFTDVWYLAGGEVVATVKDAWTSFDLGLPESVVNVGSFLSPDLEQLLAAEPDFVIASAGSDAQIELLDTFESAGVNVAYFEVSDFNDYLDMLDICTKITGKRENYEKYGTEVGKRIEEVKREADNKRGDLQPTVLFIRAAASSVKAKGSEGTVGGEILADLGCINIADSDGAILEDLSLEAIVTADPDYIFVTTQGEDTEAALAGVRELLMNSPAWAGLSAVKNGNYYEIEKELYNSKPNARWGEAYEKLAEIIFG